MRKPANVDEVSGRDMFTERALRPISQIEDRTEQARLFETLCSSG